MEFIGQLQSGLKVNKRLIMKNNLLKYFLLPFIIIGCHSGSEKESPTKGTLKLFVSETVAPLANGLAERFQDLYTDTKIEVHSTSAREAVAFLLTDSVELIIIARQLTQDEQELVTKHQLNIHPHEIAKGGFILIANDNNPIKGLRISQLDSIYDGKLKYWKDLGWKGSSSKLQFYLPGRNSDVYDYSVDKFSNTKTLPNNFYTVSTVDSVIDIVASHTNSIAMLGLNYFDKSYPNIKFLELSDRSEVTDSLGVSGISFPPEQAYVYRNHYPLRTSIYIFSSVKSVGLASGFISFVSSVQGQKIVQNNRLVPATMPVRIIQLNREEKKQ